MGDAGSACSVTLPDMLVELSVVEQRCEAVHAVIRDGVPIVQVAHRFDALLRQDPHAPTTDVLAERQTRRLTAPVDRRPRRPHDHTRPGQRRPGLLGHRVWHEVGAQSAIVDSAIAAERPREAGLSREGSSRA
jgi:hypothetical protein